MSEKPKTAKRLFGTLIILIVILAAAIAAFTFILCGQVKYSTVKQESVSHINQSVENILLIGLDTRTEGSEDGRNDLNVILSLDNVNKKIKVASILRDSYVTVPGYGKGRINIAYRSGGPGLVMDTVNKNFGMDIEEYVKVDFFGLTKIIDAVGGVTVPEVTDGEAAQIRKYSYKKSSIKAGKNLLLNGSEAVAYGRIRKTDDDFHRTDRQREIFQLLVDKMFDTSKFTLVSKLNEILPNLQTNFNQLQIMGEAIKFFTAGYDKKMLQMRIPVTGSYTDALIHGNAVLKIDIDKNKKALHTFIYGQ